MLIEWLVDVALSFFDFLMSVIPNFELNGLNDAIEYFFGVLESVCYFLPMDTVGAIFSIIYSLFILRLFIGILKTIWNIIPIL